MSDNIKLPELCSMPTHPAKYLEEHQEQFDTPNGPGLKPFVNGYFITKKQAETILEALKESAEVCLDVPVESFNNAVKQALAIFLGDK